MQPIIQQLEDDHQKILAFIQELEHELITFMQKDTFDPQTYTDAIVFVKEFADKAHHQREENILFRYMIKHAGKAAENLVRQGMLVEHDLARFYIRELELAVERYRNEKTPLDKLNILSFGKSYCELLRRHIEKENNTVYPYAQRVLTDDMFMQMEKENKSFEKSIRDKSLD